jgi:tRNA pseudouridine38-40 synthase
MAGMERYQAVIAYDGTDFFGFESQPGRRTVQSEFESALKKVGWQGSRLLAGGRTDAGVHAAGQVVAFDLAWGHGDSALQAALHGRLPKDISVVRLAGAKPNFHPRFHAIKRCYRYQVYISPWRNALADRFTVRIWPFPDVDRMNQAGRHMLGTQDFQAFGTAPRKGSHTRRTVYRAEWVISAANRLEFWMEADAFLYRMVRRTVGTLLQVGRGKKSVLDFKRLLEENPVGDSGPAVPPNGLCLMSIAYPEDCVCAGSAS